MESPFRGVGEGVRFDTPCGRNARLGVCFLLGIIILLIDRSDLCLKNFSNGLKSTQR